MKVYVLVAKDGTFNMPVTFGRSIRAYSTFARAYVYASKFDCDVVEFDTEWGRLILSTETYTLDRSKGL